jgi:hypothetical protein
MAANVSMISTYVAPVVNPMTTEEYDMVSRTVNEHLQDIHIELRVMTSLLNEGFNTKEDLDVLRDDEDDNLN